MNNTKFENKNGDLTRYAFMCGYIQERECRSQNLDIKMASDGGGGYEVRAWELGKPYKKVFWFNSSSIKVARKILKSKNYKKTFEAFKPKESLESGITEYKI